VAWKCRRGLKLSATSQLPCVLLTRTRAALCGCTSAVRGAGRSTEHSNRLSTPGVFASSCAVKLEHHSAGSGSSASTSTASPLEPGCQKAASASMAARMASSASLGRPAERSH
jgi:hypothetical protein